MTFDVKTLDVETFDVKTFDVKTFKAEESNMHMMSGVCRGVSLLGILLLSCPAMAEQLSLQQAVDMALNNNPTVAASRLSADAAGHAARGAKALVNPEIVVAPSVIGDAGSDALFLFLQPLEINGSRRIRWQIASSEAAAARNNATATTRDMVLAVKQLYWDIAKSQELLKLSQNNIDYLDTLNKVVQKQVDTGTAPGSQLLKTDVELARAKQEMYQAQLGLYQERSALNALLNRPPDTDFTVSEPLIPPDAAVDGNKLLSASVTLRPEVASAQAQLAAARGQVKAARLLQVPDLALQARKESMEGEGGVAIVMTLPILDWGSARAERRRAESAARSSQKQLDAVRNGVQLDVEQALRAYETSLKVVREYTDIIGKSEQLAAMAKKGYERGATGYLEVLEAQRTLRGTKASYVSALAEADKALARLEWAAGTSPLKTNLSEAKQ